MKDFLARLLGVAGACLTGSVALSCAAATASAPDKDFRSTVAALGWTNVGDGLPDGASRSVAIEIPGLPHGAKKLELVLVPGRDRVRPFLMAKYEVTQAQYEAVMGANPSSFKNGPDYPVETVSWNNAKEFCAKLNDGLASEVKGKLAFRLPSDEEWSLAVGLPEEDGGTPKEKDGKIKGQYPWGEQWPPPRGAGNYADETTGKKYGKNWDIIAGYDDGYAETAPVGSFQPNRLGLYDLGGNVWEWCEDWYDTDQKQRVLRGASWNLGSAHYLLSSLRDLRVPDLRHYRYGFRVVLAGAPPP